MRGEMQRGRACGPPMNGRRASRSYSCCSKRSNATRSAEGAAPGAAAAAARSCADCQCAAMAEAVSEVQMERSAAAPKGRAPSKNSASSRVTRRWLKAAQKAHSTAPPAAPPHEGWCAWARDHSLGTASGRKDSAESAAAARAGAAPAAHVGHAGRGERRARARARGGGTGRAGRGAGRGGAGRGAGGRRAAWFGGVQVGCGSVQCSAGNPRPAEVI